MRKNPQTLPEFLSWVSEKYGSKTAYKYRPRFRAETWTYEDVKNHSVVFANEITNAGINKNDCVILAGYNSPYWVAAFFAILQNGAIAVPLPPESSKEFLKKVIVQTEAKLIIKSKFSHIETQSIKSLVLEDVPKPRQKLQLKSDSFAESIGENDITEIVYTSGSTGEPKGVVLTHKNILSNALSSADAIQITKNARLLSILPLFHMLEQVGGMIVPLYVGAQVSHAASLNPNHLKWIFEDEKINRMLVVPEFLRIMRSTVLETARQNGSLKKLEYLLKIARVLPSMKLKKVLFKKLHDGFKWDMHTFVSGGAALDKDVAEFWESVGIYIIEGYGLTETSPVITLNRYNDRKPGSVGKPIEGVSVKLSKSGEILTKGPNVFKGYREKPKKTREAFDDDGWFKTGDIGFLDKDGHLHISGREKFMIVLPSGENVYPEDIEIQLNKHADVKDSAVIGLKKSSGVEVHAVLLLKQNPQARIKEIISGTNEKLMPYQRIENFSTWPYADFPRTPTRKIKRKEVEIWLAEKAEGQEMERFTPASTTKIGEIISDVLEVPPGQTSDEKILTKDFNLDSLKRIELVARIENETSVSIPEDAINQYTTVKQIKEMAEKGVRQTLKYQFDASVFGPIPTFIRAVLRFLALKPLGLIFAPYEIRGKENLKNVNNPVLFFSNHLSSADAPFIYGVLPARIHSRLAIAGAADTVYEPKEKWVRFFFFRPFLKFTIPVFPFVRRNGQVKSSFVYTGRIIDRGVSVLFFPEGVISRDTKLLPFKEGAGLLAIEMGIPIVVVKIAGTEKIIQPDPEGAPMRWHWPRRAKVVISFGKPFTLNRDIGYKEATKILERKMREL